MSNRAYELGLAQVGGDCVVWPLAKIVPPECVEFGHRVMVDDFAFIYSGPRTRLESFVHVGAHASIVGGGDFVAGEFTTIAPGARLFTGSDSYTGGALISGTVPPAYRDVERTGLRTGRHVAFGSNAIVMPGIEIGEGAVIGAGAFVSRDCEPWTTYAGAPARPLRERPRARILELESRLRDEMFDATGRYLTDAERAANSRD